MIRPPVGIEMAFNIVRRGFCGEFRKSGGRIIWNKVNPEFKCVSTVSNSQQRIAVQPKEKREDETVLESTTQDSVSQKPETGHIVGHKFEVPANFRFRYPEFLPHPKISWRNPLREKLEREDMIARRTQVELPEFYVGTIMKVTVSNIHQPNKTSDFLGICIHRDYCGLRSSFVLRNILDNLGVEMKFEMYDPSINDVEVLRLEKRLDDHLMYLRDALPEYSTFPLDMKPEIPSEGPVPVNPIKVKLKPRPWSYNWHKYDLLGVEGIEEHLNEKMIDKHKKIVQPWEKYDLMKQYRSTIPEEEQREIYAEIHEQLGEIEHRQKQTLRRRKV